MRKLLIIIVIIHLCKVAFPQVIINPGTDIQPIVNSNPPGTTYLIKAGIHRLQRITPKDNDTYLGEKGTILNGSKILTEFTKNGKYWVASGQTQQGQKTGTCRSGYDCNSPEDLFFNNVPLKHDISLDSVKTGEWFFDYTADKIYFVDDPTGKTVETSVTKHAFEGSAKNVTIKGFVIEKYANPAQFGAINTRVGNIGAIGTGWMIENNEIRLNHGTGIAFNTAKLRNNYVHDNGQLGLGGGGIKSLVENNELAHNGWYGGFSADWEAGGAKFANTDSLTVRNNYCHHNYGPGLWTDINNVHVLYEYNRCDANFEGIMHEISYDAIIRCNKLSDNGTNRIPTTWGWGAGILISASRNVKVFNNTVFVNIAYGLGISLVQQDRSTDYATSLGPHLVVNDSVYNNEIFYNGSGLSQTGNKSGIWYDTPSNFNPDILTLNYFNGNTYHAPVLSYSNWNWQSSKTWTEFQAAGQESNGILNTSLNAIPMTFSGCSATIPSIVAILTNIKVNGSPINGFSLLKDSYSIVLPSGTTSVPIVTYQLMDSKASATVTPANSLPGTTIITVTAEDNLTQRIYTVNFSNAPSTVALLNDIKVNGTSITGFNMLTNSYTVVLLLGTTTVPTVTYELVDSKATATLTSAINLPGTTTITVTAEDNLTQRIYTVKFIVGQSTGIPETMENKIKLYPLPTKNNLHVELVNHPGVNSELKVYSISGRLFYSQKVKNANLEINTSNLPEGIYLLKTFEDGIMINFAKFIKIK